MPLAADPKPTPGSDTAAIGSSWQARLFNVRRPRVAVRRGGELADDGPKSDKSACANWKWLKQSPGEPQAAC